jgi:hypothetical protein
VIIVTSVVAIGTQFRQTENVDFPVAGLPYDSLYTGEIGSSVADKADHLSRGDTQI